jgi:DNA-directed RNA polymerase specialized sigma24 family protein
MSEVFSRELPFDFHTTDITASDLPWFESPDEQKERWRREEERRRLKKKVESLLPRLTAKQQLAFRLRMQGMSYRKIARIMGVTVKSSWEILFGRKGKHGGAIRRLCRLLGIQASKQRFGLAYVGE